MAGNLKDLFETIFSVATSVGAKSAEAGGKKAVLSIAQKINWASKDSGTDNNPLRTHRLGGHRMGSGSGGGAPRDMSNYDPAKEYQSRNTEHYQKARLSGAGVTTLSAAMQSQKSGPEGGQTWLNRGTTLPNSVQVKTPQAQQPTVGLKSRIKFP